MEASARPAVHLCGFLPRRYSAVRATQHTGKDTGRAAVRSLFIAFINFLAPHRYDGSQLSLYYTRTCCITSVHPRETGGSLSKVGMVVHKPRRKEKRKEEGKKKEESKAL